MFFFDRRFGEGDGPLLLFVHGNPECSYAWRTTIDELKRQGLPEGTRIVAADNIGFGRSDQATYEMLQMRHADNLRQLIEALDLRDMTLIVHDWGGPIGIGATIDSPERVRGLVVNATSVFPQPGDRPTYANLTRPISWSQTPFVVPDRLWGVHAAAVMEFETLSGDVKDNLKWMRLLAAGATGRIPKGCGPEFAVWRDALSTKANARSSKRACLESPTMCNGYSFEEPTLGPQNNVAFYRNIQEKIGAVWGPRGQAIPVGGVFGSQDPLGKPSVVAQWRDEVPQIEENLHVLPDAFHFVQWHNPDTCAEAILDVVGELVGSVA